MEKKQWYSEIYPTIQENLFEIDSLKELLESETDPKEKNCLYIKIQGLLLANKWLSRVAITPSLKDCIAKICYLESIYEHPQFQSFINEFRIASFLHLYLDKGDYYIDDLISIMNSNHIGFNQNLELLEEEKYQNGKKKMKEFFRRDDVQDIFLDWDSSFFLKEGNDSFSSFQKYKISRESLKNLVEFKNKISTYENQNPKKK